jgi:hypothetical protein
MMALLLQWLEHVMGDAGKKLQGSFYGLAAWLQKITLD